MPAEAPYVDAEHHPLDSEGTASVRYSRRLETEMWRPAVSIAGGMIGLLLLLLAVFSFRRWRRRLRLMKKTVKDFSSDVVDIEAQTKKQATSPTTTDPSRPTSEGNPPPPPPPHKEKLGIHDVPGAVPPSPRSSSSSEARPRGDHSMVSTLLPTPTNQNPPKGMAPTPPISAKTKQSRVEARAAGALPAIPMKAIKTKQNRVEEGTASPMTAMSTEAPSSVGGVPPSGWENDSVDLAQGAEPKRKLSSLPHKAPGSIAEDEGPSSATALQRKSSSFERARGAIIGFDLDVPSGALDSASDFLDKDRSGKNVTAAPTNSAGGSSSTSQRPYPNMRSDSASDSVALAPYPNPRSDSACGSVAMDWPRTSGRSFIAGDNRMREASAPSQRSINGSGVGGRRTLEDAGVFESFASLPRGDSFFGSSGSANILSVSRANASLAVVGEPGFTNTSTGAPSRKARNLPLSPIDGLFSEGHASGRHRAHTVDDDVIGLEVAGSSRNLRASFRHRRSKTDFPSPRGGGIDFRWDSAAGSAFRESGADNFCASCLGTGVQYDSASGSVFPPSCTGTPVTPALPWRRSSRYFEGGSSPPAMYGESVDGVDMGYDRSDGARCHCVRDASGRTFGEEKRTMSGGRERSFSVSALPQEKSLSRLFEKE